jgi:hypothetical protein
MLSDYCWFIWIESATLRQALPPFVVKDFLGAFPILF